MEDTYNNKQSKRTDKTFEKRNVEKITPAANMGFVQVGLTEVQSPFDISGTS